MDEEVLIPVCCPKCGARALADFPVAVVVIALTSWKQMRLYALCCPMEWDASSTDLQAIRTHVGESWLESHRQRLAAEARAIASAPFVRIH